MTRFRVVLTLVAATMAVPTALFGGFCGNNDPAVPVPECRNQNNGQQVPCSDANAVRLWPAGLRPGLPGQTLPPERDSTDWTSTTIPGALSGHELFHGLDILGNKLYVAYNAGFQVWDIAGSNAERPSRELTKDGWRGDFLDFPSFGENDFYIDDIEVVAAGGKNLIALSGRVTVGFTVWEHSITPLGLVQKYQDLGKRSQRVRVVNQGGINYAFAGGQLGIFVYDISQAQALTAPCLDDSGTVCPGVYRGRLGETNLSLFLDAIRRDGRVYIAKSGGNGVPVEIWEVTTPSSPGTAVRRFQGLSGGGQGLAFFEVNTIPYLAVVEKVGTGWRLRIYNVNACLDTNGCGSLGPALVDRALNVAASSPQLLNYSLSNSTPFLYYGANEFGLEGDQVEQLLDLSNFPGSVSEITDSGGTYTDNCNGQTIDYWGDYYPDNDYGLRNIRPMVGKFRGDKFYRAAFGILDVHVREAQEPTLTLTGPTSGFPGEAQTFQATASGCTPSPAYNWTATGGGSVSGTGATVQITWSTPGVKTVTVTNSGCSGASAMRTITIEDPAAMVGGVSIDPAAPRVCEEILFTADGVTGQVPIGDAWTITRDSDSMVVADGSGPGFTFSWDTSALPTPIPGGYTAEVTVTNSAGSDSAQRVFTLGVAALDFDDGPTYDGAPGPRSFGTSVQFFAGASGDSSWSWDFDDPGSGSNTSNLENPTHTFATPGTYTVNLTIQSCDAEVPAEQGQVVIEIVDNPLEITSFNASCLFGVCEFCVGDPVGFFLEWEGDPDVFSYDWDGDGDFDQNSPTPVTTHTYTAPISNFFPRARISASGQEDVFTHIAEVDVNDCGPTPDPVITVSGPTTREVGQIGSYSASAFNCSASATGWSWTATGGGNITGATSTSQVSISWSTSGTKTVTASNSSCGSVTGSLNVSVSGPSIAVGGPTTRLVDQPGDYTASAENCSPAADGWNWTATGGGSISGNTSSSAVTISWGTSGTKIVAATNSGCSGAQGTRTVSVTASGGGVNAAFTYTPADPQAGEQMTFNGSASTGDIGTYFWSFGDGSPSASGPVAAHTYEAEGTYNVFLTVGESGC
ncbi:MAG: PKD domain-containing protein, partial [Thermoanaerobaculia bacterium]